MTLNNIKDVGQVLLEAGAIIMGAGFWWTSLRQGRTNFDNQAITSLQAVVAGLEKENGLIKEENTRLRNDMKEQAEKHAKLQGDMRVIEALAKGTPAIDGFTKRFEEVIIEFKKDMEVFRENQQKIIDLLTTEVNTKGRRKSDNI